MSYVNNTSYVYNMSDECRLYELYEYFYESLKIAYFFVFKKFGIFLLIYKDGKRKYWEKILEKYAKEPIFKGKEWSFRIRKNFRRIER